MKRSSGMLPHLISLLGFTAVAVAWAVFILAKGGGLPSFGEEPYHVSAVIPTGAALAPGSRVTMAGVQVGKVKEVSRQGMGARLVLEVDDEDVLPLAADSRVQVRQHTPVGENYVALVQGKATRTLASGDALPVAQSDEFVDVDRLLSVLKGPTRQRARLTTRSLGEALEGEGGNQGNRLLGGANSFIGQAYPFVDAVFRDRTQASRLIQQLGDVTAAIGQRDQAITTIAGRGLTALSALSAKGDSLRAVLEELPSSLDRIRATSQTVREVSAQTQPLVDDATVTLRDLQPTVARLQPAATTARSLLENVDGAAPQLKGVLDGVTDLSGPLPGAVPKLHKAICELAPGLRYLQPYTEEGLHILMGLGSSSNSYDATGHLIRLAPIVGENSISGAPPEVSKGLDELLYSGLIGENGGTSLDWDPYPAVGSLGKGVATDNKPVGPDEVEAAGYKYPRIQADC